MIVEIVAAVVILVALALLVRRLRDRGRASHRLTPPAKRILFPFVGNTVSKSALDAALRIARAESATLVPAYIATVPLQRSLDAPVPASCEVAMPLLETIEQRAAGLDVPVDARIETGRTPRHALRRLVEHEKFDRLVIPAESHAGFSSDDIAWLLENVDGEILVLRPASREHLREGTKSGRGAPRAIARQRWDTPSSRTT